MFGKPPRLNPLQLRKHILIAESELNRAQLVQEWQNMAGEVRLLTDRAQSWAGLASSAAALLAGLTAFRYDKRKNVDAKPSWLKSVLRFVGLGSTFWMAIRSPPRDQSEK
jgi:hypothetical protein